MGFVEVYLTAEPMQLPLYTGKKLMSIFISDLVRASKKYRICSLIEYSADVGPDYLEPPKLSLSKWPKVARAK